MAFFSCPNAAATIGVNQININENNFIINFSAYDWLQDYAAAPPANNNNTWVSSSIPTFTPYTRLMIKNISGIYLSRLHQSVAPVHSAPNNLNTPLQSLNFSLGLHNNAALVPAAFTSANLTVFIPPIFNNTNSNNTLINSNFNIPLNQYYNIQSGNSFMHFIINSRNNINNVDNNAAILVYIAANSGMANPDFIYTYLEISITGEIY